MNVIDRLRDGQVQGADGQKVRLGSLWPTPESDHDGTIPIARTQQPTGSGSNGRRRCPSRLRDTRHPWRPPSGCPHSSGSRRRG